MKRKKMPFVQREPKSYPPRPPLTSVQKQVARMQEKSDALTRHDDTAIIPQSLIERLGNALNNNNASLIWDERGECIRMAVSLRETFPTFDSGIPIFRVKIRCEQKTRVLRLHLWSVQGNLLSLTTDLPPGIEPMVKEGSRLLFFLLDINGAPVTRWSCWVVDAKPARYL